MDARKLITWTKSKTGILILLLVVLGILLLTVSAVRTGDGSSRGGQAASGPVEPIGQSVATIKRQDPGMMPDEPSPAPTPVVVIARRGVAPLQPAPVQAGIIEPIAIFASIEPPKPAPVQGDSSGERGQGSIQPRSDGEKSFSDRFAPYGRSIPCQLLFTVDSSRLETPVIGLVTQDVWWNGELIIPAGSEVHGVAQTDYKMGRIRAEGDWIVVLPGFTDVENGSELSLQGAALAREESERASGQPTWGANDGSFGLLGKTIRSDNWADVKLFIATFLGAAASTLETRDAPIISPFGGAAIQGPVQSTAQNASLSGLSAVVEQYSQRILDEIEQNGFYTRVAAGSQFYLYIRQTIDLSSARIGESEDTRTSIERRRVMQEERDRRTRERTSDSTIDALIRSSSNQLNDSPTPGWTPPVRRAQPVNDNSQLQPSNQ